MQSSANMDRVRDLLATLTKAQKDYKTYPRNNPVLIKRREELLGKFTALLTDTLELPLKVQPELLLYDDQTVYSNPDRRESIAFHLYRHGVREIRFAQGLTLHEVDQFIDAINTDFSADEADDDLITVLWTRDLPHFRYDAVDDVDPRLEWVRDPAGALHEYIVAQRELPGAEKFVNAIRLDGGQPARDPRSDLAAVNLGPDELASLKTMIDEDAARDLAIQVIEILMAVLQSNPEPAQARQLLKILERVIEISVEQRNFSRAATTLAALTQLVPQLPALETHLRGTIARFCDPKAVKHLVEIVVKPADEETPPIDELDLFRYLTLLTKQAAVPLAEGMGVIEDRKLRKVFCEALAELVKNDVNLLAGLSRDSRWFVARNVAYILGLTKNPDSLKILRSLAIHSNEKVRSEALRGAALMGPGAKDVVHRALSDADRSVRMLAYDLIVPFKDESTPQMLLAAIQDRDFENKEGNEKRALAIATARVAGDYALAPLSLLLTRKGILGSKDETRIAAAAGIAAIGSPTAVDYLKQGANAADQTLAQICGQAMREAKLT